MGGAAKAFAAAAPTAAATQLTETAVNDRSTPIGAPTLPALEAISGGTAVNRRRNAVNDRSTPRVAILPQRAVLLQVLPEESPEAPQLEEAFEPLHHALPV